MADENPQVEEPNVETPNTEDVQSELNEVLAELKKIGVETPEQVQNLHTAASQTGKAFNDVGYYKQRVKELEEAMRKPHRNDEYDYDGQTPIDLRGEVKSVLKEFWTEQNEAQRKANEAAMQEYASVRGDQDYQLIGDVFEQHMRKPETQYALNSGQTSASQEYNKMVRSYYRKIAQKSRDAIEKIQGLNMQKSAPPHVEKGTAMQPKLPEDDEKAEKIKQVKKQWTGTDDDIDRMLDALIPVGDPIFQPGQGR